MSECRRDAHILAAAILLWATIMLVHPSHGGGPPVFWRFALADLVHGIGLVTKPVLIYAFWRLSLWLGIDRPLVAIALAFFCLGQVAMLSAGVVSGWITPAVQLNMHGLGHGNGLIVDPSVTAAIGRFSATINHGFATVYTALVSGAILLWSIGWTQRTILEPLIRYSGIVIGAGLLLWQLSGVFMVSASTMIIVALSHTAWAVAAATAFSRVAQQNREVGHA